MVVVTDTGQTFFDQVRALYDARRYEDALAYVERTTRSDPAVWSALTARQHSAVNDMMEMAEVLADAARADALPSAPHTTSAAG